MFGWKHAEKPLCVNVNGQLLAVPPPRQNDAVAHLESVFICVNNGEPFSLGLESAINYFELVVFEKMTHQVHALVPGGRTVASEITNAGELRNYLQLGHMINMRPLKLF